MMRGDLSLLACLHHDRHAILIEYVNASRGGNRAAGENAARGLLTQFNLQAELPEDAGILGIGADKDPRAVDIVNASVRNERRGRGRRELSRLPERFRG